MRTLEQLLAELKELCVCGEAMEGKVLCIYCDARGQITEQKRVLENLNYAREKSDQEDMGMYSAAYAIRIATLWRAGKMIGADKDQILFALLREIERRMTP